jgi:DNA-binding transcriptional regulator YiaG
VRQIQQGVLSRIKARMTSEESLIEAIEKFKKITPQKNCLVCGRKLISQEHKYCSDQCRRKVMYEHGGVNKEEIRAKRLALMLTQAQLAAYIGVTKETIRSWENGITKPNFYNFLKLCSFFDKNKTEIAKVYKITGGSLREFRESFGLSQRQLAEFLGVSNVTISSWERKKNKPDFFYQRKLREIFKNPQKLKSAISPKEQSKNFQLMLFDVSLYTKSKANSPIPRGNQAKQRRKRRRSEKKEAFLQFALW